MPTASISPLETVDWDQVLADFCKNDPSIQADVNNPELARDEIEIRLLDIVEEVANEWLTDPFQASRGSTSELRFGANGGRTVGISGPYAGRFKDFDSDYSGRLLGLIAFGIAGERIPDPQHHHDAVLWARQRLGFGDGPIPAPDPATVLQRAQDRADGAVATEAYRAGRAALAQKLWAGAVAIDGTAAELYLTSTRKIPKPAAGWPASIGFHPGNSSLIVCLTLADGTVSAVQEVFITDNGRKQVGFGGTRAKKTTGPMAGAVVRFPGKKTRPLTVEEGPETALSVWVSTGYETWATCGSISRVDPPVGRKVIAGRDDDKRGSSADVNRVKGLARWTQSGVTFREVWPWAERKYNKTDFNDLIKSGGVEAVLRAFEPSTPLPPVKRMKVSEARTEVSKRIKTFVDLAKGGDKPVNALRIDLGVGKSSETRKQLSELIRYLRANKDGRTIGFAVPTRTLADEAAKGFDMDIRVAVWRGRKAPNPMCPGETMCQNAEAVAEAQSIMADVDATVCGNSKTEHKCPFYKKCAYLRQRKFKPDVWLFAHELLYLERPTAMKNLGFLVIDESAWQDGLIGQGHPIWLSIYSLLDAPAAQPDADGLTDLPVVDLVTEIRRKIFDALDSQPEGPVSRSAMRAAGITANEMAGLHAAEWQRIVHVVTHPGMTLEERKAASKVAAHNKSIKKHAMLCKILESLVGRDGPELSGHLEIGADGDGQKQLKMRGRSEVKEGWKLPTLILDATMNVDLLRYHWPDVEQTADISVETPFQYVRQVIDRSYTSNYLAPRIDTIQAVEHREELHATLSRLARRYSGRVLVVVQKRVQEYLKKMAPLPSNITLEHHNNIAGRDEWKDVEALIVVGRTAPSPWAVEAISNALTGVAVEPVKRLPGAKSTWYQNVVANREMIDGEAQGMADRHPDPITEAIRWTICEGELMQIIGRARGVNRTEANPVDVWIMTDVVLPIPVDETITAISLDPTPYDRMMSDKGVAFFSSCDAAVVFPQFWLTPKAAEHAFSRETTTRVAAGTVSKWTYQRAGAGKRRMTVDVDEARHTKPAEALEAMLGELTYVSRTERTN